MFEHKRMKVLVSEKLWGRFRGKMKPNFGKWNELIMTRNCGQHNGACLGIPGNMVAKHSKETRGSDNTKQNRTTSGLPGTSAVIRSIFWKFSRLLLSVTFCQQLLLALLFIVGIADYFRSMAHTTLYIIVTWNPVFAFQPDFDEPQQKT